MKNEIILVDKITDIIEGGYICAGITCICDDKYDLNDYVVFRGKCSHKRIIVNDSHSIGYPDAYNDAFIEGRLEGVFVIKNDKCIIYVNTGDEIVKIKCNGNKIQRIPVHTTIRVAGKINKTIIKAELIEAIID